MSKTVMTFVAALLLGMAARAHDPLLSTADARVRPEGLTVQLVMAKSNARNLLDDPLDGPFTRETFGQFHAPLRAAGGALFEVSSSGALVEPVFVDASMTPEEDVRFDITYRPPAGAPLLVQARFLRKMPAGHVSDFKLWDPGPNSALLAGAELEAGRIGLAFTPPEMPSPTVAAAAKPESSPAPPQDRNWVSWFAAPLAGGVGAWMAWVLLRKRTND